MQYLMLFHCNSSSTNAPQCYVTRTLHVLLPLYFDTLQISSLFRLTGLPKRYVENLNKIMFLFVKWQRSYDSEWGIARLHISAVS